MSSKNTKMSSKNTKISNKNTKMSSNTMSNEEEDVRKNNMSSKNTKMSTMSSEDVMSSEDTMSRKIIDFMESTKDRRPDITKFDELLKLNVEMYANSTFEKDEKRRKQFIDSFSHPESKNVSLLNFRSAGKESPSIYIDENGNHKSTTKCINSTK